MDENGYTLPCPHISLASPWSAPLNISLDNDLHLVEEEKELLLLKINNIALLVTGLHTFQLLHSTIVSGWELPAQKLKVNMTHWEAKYGKARARKMAGQCNRSYATVHCGPIAVPYTMVVVRWPGGSLKFGKGGLELKRVKGVETHKKLVEVEVKESELAQCNSTKKCQLVEPVNAVNETVRETEETFDVATTELTRVKVVKKYKWDEVAAIRVTESEEPRIQRRKFGDFFSKKMKTAVNVTLANDWQLRVIMSNETFNIWKKKNNSVIHRPWIELISFPLGTEASGLLNRFGPLIKSLIQSL